MQVDAGSNLLLNWIARAAQRTPDKPWWCRPTTAARSLRPLHDTVRRFAAFLRQRGLGRNDRVALLANNSIEHLALLSGRDGRRRHHLHHPRRDEPQSARQYFRAAQAEAHPLPGRPAARRSLGGRRGAAPAARPLGPRPSRTRCSASWRAARRASRECRRGPDDDAVILFTSGTSATPKGVVLSYREFLSQHRSAGRRLRHHGGRSALRFPPVQLEFGADFWARCGRGQSRRHAGAGREIFREPVFPAPARPRRDDRHRQSDDDQHPAQQRQTARIATICRSCASSRRARRRCCSRIGSGSSRNSASRSRRAAAPAK